MWLYRYPTFFQQFDISNIFRHHPCQAQVESIADLSLVSECESHRTAGRQAG